jgi:hypothetical protein
VLESHRLDPKEWPPAAVIVVLSAISRDVRTAEAFGVEIGRDETIELVERAIRALEGPRAHSSRTSRRSS